MTDAVVKVPLSKYNLDGPAPNVKKIELSIYAEGIPYVQQIEWSMPSWHTDEPNTKSMTAC